MGLGLDETLGPGRVLLNHVTLSAVGRITPDPRLVPMQQLRQDLAVIHIGHCGCDRMRMNQFGVAVDATMRLHAEVPRLPFLGLVYLEIPRLGAILRRTRCRNNGRIHDGAPGDLQALGSQLLADLRKEGVTHPMGFQQMPEFAERGFIGHGLAVQINPHELSHGARVVQSLLHGWI